MRIPAEKLIDYLGKTTNVLADKFGSNIETKLEKWARELPIEDFRMFVSSGLNPTTPIDYLLLEHQLKGKSFHALAADTGINFFTLHDIFSEYGLPRLNSHESSKHTLSSIVSHDKSAQSSNAQNQFLNPVWEMNYLILGRMLYFINARLLRNRNLVMTFGERWDEKDRKLSHLNSEFERRVNDSIKACLKMSSIKKMNYSVKCEKGAVRISYQKGDDEFWQQYFDAVQESIKGPTLCSPLTGKNQVYSGSTWMATGLKLTKRKRGHGTYLGYPSPLAYYRDHINIYGNLSRNGLAKKYPGVYRALSRAKQLDLAIPNKKPKAQND